MGGHHSTEGAVTGHLTQAGCGGRPGEGCLGEMVLQLGMKDEQELGL